jgi:hypothetical protein
MHRKVKVLIARWLASRIETRTRRLRRALRDHQRAELRRIRATDRRARGLRLYAAWSCKEKEPMNFGTVVPLRLHRVLGSRRTEKPHKLDELVREQAESDGTETAPDQADDVRPEVPLERKVSPKRSRREKGRAFIWGGGEIPAALHRSRRISAIR